MLSEIYDYIKNKHMSITNDKFTYIGDGHFRDVYRINTSDFGRRYQGCVVKLAKRSRSIKANQAEFHTWMAVKGTELEKYFCPILDRTDDYRILVMEYAEHEGTTYETANEIDDKIRGNTDLQACPIDLQNRLDIKPQNIGMYNGRYVLVDYPWGGDFKK